MKRNLLYHQATCVSVSLQLQPTNPTGLAARSPHHPQTHGVSRADCWTSPRCTVVVSWGLPETYFDMSKSHSGESFLSCMHFKSNRQRSLPLSSFKPESDGVTDSHTILGLSRRLPGWLAAHTLGETRMDKHLHH